jgi:uncharacterized protein YpmB
MKSPYNTYVNFGLPPGPIANPGKESIIAALRPAKADYIYFVSRNDGTHQFSKTLKEHNRAVNLFQRSVKLTKKADIGVIRGCCRSDIFAGQQKNQRKRKGWMGRDKRTVFSVCHSEGA